MLDYWDVELLRSVGLFGCGAVGLLSFGTVEICWTVLISWTPWGVSRPGTLGLSKKMQIYRAILVSSWDVQDSSESFQRNRFKGITSGESSLKNHSRISSESEIAQQDPIRQWSSAYSLAYLSSYSSHSSAYMHRRPDLAANKHAPIVPLIRAVAIRWCSHRCVHHTAVCYHRGFITVTLSLWLFRFFITILQCFDLLDRL